MAGVPQPALAQRQAATELHRTQFTTDDGLPGAVVDAIQQTPDGFLWVATNQANLARFDGRRFHHFANVRRTIGVAVADDGGLWIGTRPELLRVPPGDLRQFAFAGIRTVHPGNARGVSCVRAGRNGGLWVGTDDGLFRYDGKEFTPVGLASAHAP